MGGSGTQLSLADTKLLHKKYIFAASWAECAG